MKLRAPRLSSLSRLVGVAFFAASVSAQTIGSFPSVAVPPGNPLTPDKVLLGKALFFEEQVSSDGTMACATCHLPEAGGADIHAGTRQPGNDHQFFTADDEFGSPGMVRQDPTGAYLRDPAFGIARQATNRNAPTVFGAAFFDAVFWDKRAGQIFRDEAGQVVLPALAALESQAVFPPVSPIEMGHDARPWSEVVAKLERIRPLDLARDLPQPLADFIVGATYGDLFQRAFGSPGITRERFAMAIASYERTLVPNHTPYDLSTMTPLQTTGFTIFQIQGNCSQCHTVSNGLFSSGLLATINVPGHQRNVKIPTLRNVGLQRRLTSSGFFANLDEVVTHYENQRFFPSPLTAGERRAVLAFLGNGLTDERVLRRDPPFDRPTLHSEVEPVGSNQYGQAWPGTGGFLPELVSHVPAILGSPDFKLGLGNALGGSTAFLMIGAAQSASGTTFHGIPLHVAPTQFQVLARPLSAGGAGQGVATFQMPLPGTVALIGLPRYVQAFVPDPDAIGGFAASRGARIELVSERLAP
ncbi:MAG: hypothetical protein EXS08_06805 [Planctomycetes bacterium]|nr:hypothetical protein [Planctomycetota bacterium]